MSSETILITGIGSEMQGVGRLSDGRAVFVPFAIPGETVNVRIEAEKERFCTARLIDVLEPSPDRVTPLCPHFGVCGGCQTQHIAYARALQLKRQRVADALSHLGGVQAPEVGETLASPETLGYRNKAEFAFDGEKAGVCEGGTHRVIDLAECPLQADGANRVLAFVRAHRRGLPLKNLVVRTNAAGEMMVTLSLYARADATRLARAIMTEISMVRSVYACELSRRPAHALDGICRRLAGTETISETLDGLRFSVSPQSFFQVNRPQAERLYGEALALAALKPGDRVCDVYCGAGTITLFAARTCARATGIEIVAPAVADARKNAEANQLSHRVQFMEGDAAALYPGLQKREHFDAVIVDPPRKGLDEPVIRALCESPADKLVYVSCNPATLARDLRLLASAYRLAAVRPVDMFPQTGHVETVVLLSKGEVDSKKSSC